VRGVRAAILTLVASSALTACNHAADPGAARDGAAVSADAWNGVFAPFPGARRLCSQHVTGNGMHILWTAYATEKPTAEVIGFYEKNHGAAAIERDHGFTLRGPNEHLLSVHAKDESYPRCEVAPAAGDATVIIVSQAVR
jgi:hypothetical protein